MIAGTLVGTASLLVLLALAAGLRARLLAGSDPGWAGAAGGAALALVVALLDGGQVLQWRFGVFFDGARIALPGVALVLGLALLVAVAGTLLTAAALVAGSAPGEGPRILGRRILILAAGLGALACGLMAWELLSRGARPAAGLDDIASLLAATGFLAVGLTAMLSDPVIGDAAGLVRRAARLTQAAALCAAAAVVAAGVEAWLASGGYLTARSLAVLAAALVALAAREATALPNGRRALAFAALVFALAP